MSEMRVEYQGKKRCELLHKDSGASIITDAPVDNFGKGGGFSPTDLMSASLGACMLTIMGIQLEPLGVNLDGAYCTLQKQMASSPRRIFQIDIELQMPAGIEQKHRARVQEIAQTCPVQFSLNPEIKIELKIIYPE